MLDLDFIRTDPQRVRDAILHKGVDLDLDAVLAADAANRTATARLEALRAARKRNARSFTAAPDRQEARAKAHALDAELRTAEATAKHARDVLDRLLLRVPNIPWNGAPIGPDAAANRLVRRVGEPPTFDFAVQDHVALMDANGWGELRRIANVAGARSYALKGALALLEQVLLFDTMQRLQNAGFTPITVPSLARPRAFVGTGHFPGGEDDVFALPADELYLAGTAEIALTSLHGGEILDERDLPLRYAALSPCFRREAGSAGRDVRGLLRVHQFYKIEQFVICRTDDEESAAWHAHLLGNAEAILQALELPYQIVECSTGDMGAGKVRMNDVETWVPSLGTWRETHSCSTFHDWQARRAGLRYRDRSGRVRFAHTLNNTAIATPRILVPLLENHQQATGEVHLPVALRHWFGGRTRL